MFDHFEPVSPQITPKCLFEICYEAINGLSLECKLIRCLFLTLQRTVDDFPCTQDHAVLIFACSPSVFGNPLMGLEEKIDASDYL